MGHTPRTLFERAVMMDTSGYLAIEEQRPDALLCVEIMRREHIPVFVGFHVIVESHRRFLHDHGREAASRFLTEAHGDSATILRATAEHEERARSLIARYSTLSLTYCDALTQALMLDLGILRVFSYDLRDFSAVGFVTIPPIYL